MKITIIQHTFVRHIHVHWIFPRSYEKYRNYWHIFIHALTYSKLLTV